MVTVLWYTNNPHFCSLSWFLRCKEHTCPLSPNLGLWRMLQFLDWGLSSGSWLRIVHGYWYSRVLNFDSLSWFWRCKEHPCSLSPYFWALEDTEVTWLRFGVLILNWIESLIFDTPMFQALEDSGDYWSGFGILILIWIRLVVFDKFCSKFWLTIWILRCKEHWCSLSPVF